VAPPLLGQHTLEILSKMGLGIDEIESLRARGII
jgi:crotonobetainyl-CoA:carnitine CoA-transferase CaiB-like acyl-CoA transferase